MIKYVQSQVSSTAAATSLAVSFDDATQTGNYIAVFINFYAAVSITGLSDNRSNSYAANDFTTATNQNLYWRDAHNISGGATTVTATFSGSTAAEICIREYSGIKTSSAYIKAATIQGDDGKSDTSSTPSTYETDLKRAPGTDNLQTLLIAAGASQATQTWTVGENFGNLDQVNNASASLAVADKIVDLTNEAETYKATFSTTSSAQWLTSLTAYADFTPSITPKTITTHPTTYWSD